MVAEDQALIGMALEASLEDAGITVAGPFPSCAEALSWTEAQTPALAILDFKLRAGPCTELVTALRAREVPVIIYSGLPRGADASPELEGVTWLEKPVDRAHLLAAAVRLAPTLAQHAPETGHGPTPLAGRLARKTIEA